MSYLVLCIILFLTFAFRGKSSPTCPCLTAQNQIVWGEFVCSNFNQFPILENDPAGEDLSIPSFCPQPIENCDSSSVCEGDWAHLENCDSSCPNNMELWKRSCNDETVRKKRF